MMLKEMAQRMKLLNHALCTIAKIRAWNRLRGGCVWRKGFSRCQHDGDERRQRHSSTRWQSIPLYFEYSKTTNLLYTRRSTATRRDTDLDFELEPTPVVLEISVEDGAALLLDVLNDLQVNDVCQCCYW